MALHARFGLGSFFRKHNVYNVRRECLNYLKKRRTAVYNIHTPNLPAAKHRGASTNEQPNDFYRSHLCTPSSAARVPAVTGFHQTR